MELWSGAHLVGVSSRQAVRTRTARGDLVRVRRGVYGAGDPHEEDGLRALFLRLPQEALLTGVSALRRYGIALPDDGSVHVHLPPEIPRPRLPGLVVHHAVLPVAEPAVLGGLPCVPAVRCAVDLARSARRLDALPVLDAVLRAKLADPEELRAEVRRHVGLRGVCQARQLVPIADGRAECRQESQLRLVLIDGGLPAPEPQVWVYDSAGIGRYRLDLGYRDRMIGIEYDGLSHLDRERLRHDRDRANWLDAHGWTMRYFTDRDLYRRPHHILTTIRAALTP
ncbi:DUF559 domain-containing protein [Micromonospora coxensis]|uniref:DUF559 domain-containing protein n=1 Tax=Micromonospora coxensis TaxID=356852 RepID=UPI00341841AB